MCRTPVLELEAQGAVLSQHFPSGHEGAGGPDWGRSQRRGPGRREEAGPPGLHAQLAQHFLQVERGWAASCPHPGQDTVRGRSPSGWGSPPLRPVCSLVSQKAPKGACGDSLSRGARGGGLSSVHVGELRPREVKQLARVAWKIAAGTDTDPQARRAEPGSPAAPLSPSGCTVTQTPSEPCLALP